MIADIAVWMLLVVGGVANTPQAGHEIKDTTEPLRIRVSPAVCLEPGIVEVMVRIPGNPDNRALSVTLDAFSYYSNSTTALDGEADPATRLFAYRSLPPGEYIVTVKVKNRQGRTTVAEHNFRVLGRTDGGGQQ